MLSKKKPDPIATNFAAIKLTHGMTAIVDPEDYEWLNKWKWKAQKSAHCWYAVRNYVVNGATHQVKMHRAIVGCPDNLETHHWNRKSLDNRKSNLEKVTPEYHKHIHQCNW